MFSNGQTRVVPAGKRAEEEFQRFFSNWIGQSLRGAFAAAIYNQPRDLRDYAYENSKVMAISGRVQYPAYPTSCVGCDWSHYQVQESISNLRGQTYQYPLPHQQARITSIQNHHDIDFTSVGYPLQSVTGGRGYCVQYVDEFYGVSATYSPTTLLENLLSRTTAEGTDIPLHPP